MNISKHEQRTLHVLAQGGHVRFWKDERGKIIDIHCITREGWTLADCSLPVFRKLRKRRFIASQNGGHYRITRDGLFAVRAQPDNR
ncbi:MAG TPA: hypothetical protein DCW68_02080 [Rhodospirillaceae bacterium]|nr:MAG: hypothetical protein A2018_05045 [Alphaproteobacteria bacterium GWF2_58_20]HAU28883.1 hypothetical protein [Rhodospirillaceae bacterium]